MQKVGQELGLDATVVAELTLHTALGAAAALASDKTASELRQQVTSPGGTTQATIDCFQAAGIEDIFREAMISAVQRAEQMSNDFRTNFQINLPKDRYRV